MHGQVEVVTLIEKQEVNAIFQLAGYAILLIWHIVSDMIDNLHTQCKGAKIHSVTCVPQVPACVTRQVQTQLSAVSFLQHQPHSC